MLFPDYQLHCYFWYNKIAQHFYDQLYLQNLWFTIIMENPTPVNPKASSFNGDKFSKSFTAKHNLNIHSRTVHKELERCSLCNHPVKNLVQHNTRYHADISKGRRQCQYCLRWYMRICAHKCSRQSHQRSHVPIPCAPTRITEVFNGMYTI